MALIDHVSENGATVLSIYNVVSQANKGVRDSIGITVDPKDLIANIQNLLDNGWRAVDVKDVVAGGPTLTKCFALMACDGYDLDDTLMEFLRDNNISVAFSIATRLVGNNTPSWTNQIEIALEDMLEANPKGLCFNVPGMVGVIHIRTVEEAIAARNILKDLKPADMDGDEYVAQICTMLTPLLSQNKITPTLVSDSPFDRKMTWDQIRELDAAGHTLISHGGKHTNSYTNLESTEITADILMAYIDFRDHVCSQRTILTYPEGGVNDDVVAAVQDSGVITAAFTMEDGSITEETDRMRLPRVTVTQDMLSLG